VTGVSYFISENYIATIQYYLLHQNQELLSTNYSFNKPTITLLIWLKLWIYIIKKL